MINYVNPVKAVKPLNQPSVRKRKLSATKITSSNIDNIISLQQRYNGNITRPDVISDILSTKNSSANLSILPDAPNIRRSPFPPIAHSSSTNKSSPTTVNMSKDRLKPPGIITSAQNLSRKAPPTTTSQKNIYSSDLITNTPLATNSSLPYPGKTNAQVRSQIQAIRELQTMKSHHQTPKAYTTSPVSSQTATLNTKKSTNVRTSPSPTTSQSARTTPVKSVDYSKATAAPINRTMSTTMRTKFVNSSAGNSNNIHKINNMASGALSGNPTSHQVEASKKSGPRPPPRVLTNSQPPSVIQAIARTETQPKIAPPKVKPNLVNRNKSSGLQISAARTVMSPASQNSIPQKEPNLRSVLKSPTVSVPKKVVFRGTPSVPQSSQRDSIKNQKYRFVQPSSSSQSSISITKTNSPVGSDVRARSTPVISSAVSLHKIPATSRISTQPTTSSLPPVSRPIAAQKRVVEVSFYFI